jgi:hypothetical protein
MPLPKIDVPIYELKVPSTGKIIKVRPFTVKEEKLLFMALEANKMDDVVATVKQVINNCIVDGDIDIEKMPFFDVDFIFIYLRAKSIGEKVEIRLTCNNVVEDRVCGHVFNTDLDINNSEIVYAEDITNDIKLDSNKGVKMKYPGYSVVKNIESASPVDQRTILIVNSIEYIYDGKTMHSAKDYSKDELKKFVEDLTEENYNKMAKFVDNFPVFVVTMDATCSKCGFHHHVRYSDFYDFFF